MRILKNYTDDQLTLISGSLQNFGTLTGNWTQNDYQLALSEIVNNTPPDSYSNGFPQVVADPSLPPPPAGPPQGQPDQSAIGQPNPNFVPYVTKLSVFSAGDIFLGEYTLEEDKEYYIKNNQIYLRPNELLDREAYSGGNYSLQFDFLYRYQEKTDDPIVYNHFFISEISQTRKEIRLSRKNRDNFSLDPAGDNILVDKITQFFNNENDKYNFDSFIELPNAVYLPINAYIFDRTSKDITTLIIKLNQPLPLSVPNLSHELHIVRKIVNSQREDIFFNAKDIADFTSKYVEIDTGYLQEESNVNDGYKNYNQLTESLGTNLISQLGNDKKDLNLNIDYSKFKNHAFFGSAKQKLINFKDKAVTIEGLYSELSSSFVYSSSKEVVNFRRKLFSDIENIKTEFTSYEKFLYNDNQNFSSASAPGIGINLAGNNFKNNAVTNGTNHYSQSLGLDGFDLVHKKRHDQGFAPALHVFTDIYNAEQPPFFNTNQDVYLSFILKGKEISDPEVGLDLHVSGGMSNVSFGVDKYKGYDYGRNRKIPFEAYKSGSLLQDDEFYEIQNPTSTGSIYKRYIFKGKQNNWRPTEHQLIQNDIFNQDLENDTMWSGSDGLYYQILSSSQQTISSSVSGSIGDGFAYGIKDSSGQHTQYLFPLFQDDNNLSSTFTFNTASVLPQGDLFPITAQVSSSSTNKAEVFFTDVKVSYNDPSDIHPFSTIYRPPSGSYGGSTEWNSWYDGMIASASLYDTQNIHSLINNLPLSLREHNDHEILRRFVNMLAEQFDLLRNYIDNYLNFYRLGYSNPHSMPDNLLPILGDAVGWKLLNPYSSSLEDYASGTGGDEVGVKNVINSTWKKILNNLLYVYKVKGSTESINSLLNLYGFDSSGFKMHEYGGSTAEHNPTIITNDSQDFLEGMKNIKGNVSFVQNVQPFPMMNFRGTNSLGVDWWRNDAETNGVEFVFNADKSGISQTILRSSGSNNDLWDLQLIPSASSNTVTKLQFRLNASNSGSGTLATSAISMSSPFSGDFTTGSIWNVFLQRDVVTGSNQHNAFTQSYHMFVSRKDDDKIKDVSHISMSSDQLSLLSASYANYNFVNQHQSKALNNLFIGESLSGSLSEFRTWTSYVSMSKFKQHTINYQSIVGNKITSSIDDLLYRYKFDEGIVNWAKTEGSSSLKVNDYNSTRLKDYSILIASQDNFNYKTSMTEQTFYKLAVKGTDKLPNDNQTNLAPKLTSEGQLNPDVDIVSEPKDSSGKVERQFTNKFGRDMSYVNAIDSFVMNMLPDFRVDDFIGDPDEQLTETYEDLLRLRKSLIGDPKVSIDVGANIRAAENLLSNEVVSSLDSITPAKTNFEMFYDIKNDTLFRSKIGKRTQITTKLNPNKAIGKIDAGDFDEPSVTSFANNNIKNGTIDADNSSEPSLIGSIRNITSNTKINYIDTSKSINQKQFKATPKVGSHDMNQFFLGPKNNIAKNYGTASHNRFIISSNPGENGDFNTYKFESRFTFKTIGDTERFHNSMSIHDNFKSFRNRHFVDKNHVSNYKYKSFFGVGAGDGALRDGRMVGRTRFYSSSNGEIFYPSNHYIHARTSKDSLYNLIYKGTQFDGSNPTKDPIDRDPQPKEAAYIINVGGADTVQRIKVERPISATQRTITIQLDKSSGTGEFEFELFNKRTSVLTQTISSPSSEKVSVTFAQIGEISNYNFKMTPSVGNVTKVAVVATRPPTRFRPGRKPKLPASLAIRRVKLGSGRGITAKITAAKSDFTIRVLVN